MKINIIQSSLYLSAVYEALIAKQELVRTKMERYNEVKLYLFSFILPEYSSEEYVKESLKLYNDNPIIAFKNENGIIHLVLCFEHNKED